MIESLVVIWWSAKFLAGFDLDRCLPCKDPVQVSEYAISWNPKCGEKDATFCPLRLSIQDGKSECYDIGFRSDGVVLWKLLPEPIDPCAELENP